MTRRRAMAKKKRQSHQNRFSMILVTIVVALICVVVLVKRMEMREKLDTYNTRVEQLEQQIDFERDRANEIEEYRKYTQTKKYVEEVAKDKLGLVNEGEILFIEE